MMQRYEHFLDAFSNLRLQLGYALRQSLAQGYKLRDFRSDLLAGIVVGIIALPLSMALAIATGVPPQYGLYTAIIAGFVIALLGGSRVQVSGPTAAFVVILAPIVARYGMGGLLVTSLMAGFLLMGLGIFRLGRLIEFIPYPVTTGFTAGIAVVIATLQLKDFLGLTIDHMPERYPEKILALYHALPTTHWPDLLVGIVTLAVLILWPRLTRIVPAALIALLIGVALALSLQHFLPGTSIATIASRFPETAGIPQQPPMFIWPWMLPGADGEPLPWSLGLVELLMLSAFAIAMLCAIESLLSAVVADGMTGHKHNPDSELLAQGIGNVIAPFFGGFAATGAIARTAANIRSGGRTPISAVVHSGFILLAILLMAPLLGYLPMASMAALLLVVAWNMSEARHFAHMLRVSPKHDVAVLLACFSLTVIFDMVIAVSIGVMMAAVLFMHRMADVSGVRLVGDGHPQLSAPLPSSVLLYEIAGPLFFGAAQRAMATLHGERAGVKAVILDMGSAPIMDATGLVNLESAIGKLQADKILVILADVRDQPASLLAKAGWRDTPGKLLICRDFAQAEQRLRNYLNQDKEV